MNLRSHLTELLPYRSEMEVRRYAAGVLVEAGFHVRLDGAGNLLGRAGNPWLCLNAHMDAVPAGMGADDRVGIAAILAAIEESQVPVAVLLTTNEETGQRGARALADEWWQGIEYCVSLDRRGHTDIVDNYGGKRICDKALTRRVEYIAQRIGMYEARAVNSDSIADAVVFAEHVPALNIACGFYEEHTGREYFVEDDVRQAARVAMALLEDGPQ